MDSTGEQLHPNWRALATIRVPLKRFIPEGTDAAAKGSIDDQGAKYEILGTGSGQEVRQFYDEITNESTSNVRTKIQKSIENVYKPRRQIPVEMAAEPFEAENYFRAAMTNNVQKLQKTNYRADVVNSRDAYGWTALMMAACAGAEEAIRFILELGADRTMKDKSGSTAADLARKKNLFHIVDLLENYQISDSKADKFDADLVAPLLEPFFCTTCQRTFAETTQRQHQTSTVHQFNAKSTMPENKLQKFNISARNRGLQLMVKQGWNKESGLGPEQSGRLYPVKTVIRKQRTGLGIEQPAARVTHFEAFDLRATQRHNSDYYKKKPRNRNDIRREKKREWKRERRLRNELS